MQTRCIVHNYGNRSTCFERQNLQGRSLWKGKIYEISRDVSSICIKYHYLIPLLYLTQNIYCINSYPLIKNSPSSMFTQITVLTVRTLIFRNMSRNQCILLLFSPVFLQFFFLTYYTQDSARSFNILLKVKLYITNYLTVTSYTLYTFTAYTHYRQL